VTWVKDLFRDPCADAPVTMNEVCEAARRVLAGQLTEREFVAWAHCHVGHDGPDELQNLVEMDDEYDPNIDADADRRFISDGKPAQVRSFAEVLASSPGQ
jgi:hypothetical protein